MSESSLTFPKHMHLRSSAEFAAVFAGKKSVLNSVMVVYGIANGRDFCRLGLSVSRKVGNAVIRNRWRRLFREAFRLLQHDIPQGMDLVFIPRKGIADPGLAQITTSLQKLLPALARKIPLPQ